jgi:AcrR family transcriptional regulator
MARRGAPLETRPGVVGQARSDETRARAIEAAVGCLAELGFARTTFQDIARRAGMSPGPLQYHFRSKPEMMAAVAQHLLQDRAQAFAPLVAETAPDAGALRRFLERTQSYCRTDEFLAAVELLVAARGDAELREAIARATGSRRGAQKDAFATLLAARAGLDARRGAAWNDLVTALAAGLAIDRSVGQLTGAREQAVWDLLGEIAADAAPTE